jgi:hypothetical protein
LSNPPPPPFLLGGTCIGRGRVGTTPSASSKLRLEVWLGGPKAIQVQSEENSSAPQRGETITARVWKQRRAPASSKGSRFRLGVSGAAGPFSTQSGSRFWLGVSRAAGPFSTPSGSRCRLGAAGPFSAPSGSKLRLGVSGVQSLCAEPRRAPLRAHEIEDLFGFATQGAFGSPRPEKQGFRMDCAPLQEGKCIFTRG